MTTKSTHPALSPAFFNRDSVLVARELLGQLLVVQTEAASPWLYRIVETEAYTQDDPSCHAYQRPVGRAATLYKAPGLAYVYFTYGMHHCLNVVTEPEGRAGAVLFRGLEPLNLPPELEQNTRGPGRLCKALGITRATHNELSLCDPNNPFYISPGESIENKHVITTTRIGISKAQEYPWRFYIDHNPWVSVRHKPKSPSKVAL